MTPHEQFLADVAAHSASLSEKVRPMRTQEFPSQWSLHPAFLANAEWMIAEALIAHDHEAAILHLRYFAPNLNRYLDSTRVVGNREAIRQCARAWRLYAGTVARFDLLDPAPGTMLDVLRETTKRLRNILRAAGLRSFQNS